MNVADIRRAHREPSSHDQHQLAYRSQYPPPEDSELYADPDTSGAVASAPQEPMPSPSLPALPKHELELSLDSILGQLNGEDAPRAEVERVQKRASNVLKLSEENEKLNQELKAMAERLEAAERKRAELEGQMKGENGNGY